MSKSDWNQIKTMLNVGISVTKICTITGRAYGTVAWVRKSSTFDDYRKQISGYIKSRVGSRTTNGDTTTVTYVKGLNREKVLAEVRKAKVAILNLEAWLMTDSAN